MYENRFPNLLSVYNKVKEGNFVPLRSKSNFEMCRLEFNSICTTSLNHTTRVLLLLEYELLKYAL